MQRAKYVFVSSYSYSFIVIFKANYSLFLIIVRISFKTCFNQFKTDLYKI